MENQGRYHHLRVDWVGESSTQLITLCGVDGEAIGTEPTLCPDCAQVDEALNVCGLGPESLARVIQHAPGDRLGRALLKEAKIGDDLQRRVDFTLRDWVALNARLGCPATKRSDGGRHGAGASTCHSRK